MNKDQELIKNTTRQRGLVEMSDKFICLIRIYFIFAREIMSSSEDETTVSGEICLKTSSHVVLPCFFTFVLFIFLIHLYMKNRERRRIDKNIVRIDENDWCSKVVIIVTIQFLIVLFSRALCARKFKEMFADLFSSNFLSYKF